MGSLLNMWFERKVIERLKNINSSNERLAFLYTAKDNFIRDNTPNLDAPPIIERFDNLIEKEKALAKMEISTFDKAKTDKKKEPESLSEIINHPEGEKVVSRLKPKINYIHGKRLKLLLLAFQQTNLLLSNNVSLFYRLCKKEFNWDIGSYPGINNYEFNDRLDQTELDQFKKLLLEITSTIQ